MSWAFVDISRALALHTRQLAEHGGSDGIRDLGALQSALARPVNLAEYEVPDAAQLAAAYLCGIAKAHAFIDGNKRTAWVIAKLFLRKNRDLLPVSPGEALRLVEGAASDLSPDEVAAWLRARILPE